MVWGSFFYRKRGIVRLRQVFVFYLMAKYYQITTYIVKPIIRCWSRTLFWCSVIHPPLTGNIVSLFDAIYVVFGILCEMISFQSISLGSLQLAFHIIAFLADLSEAKGRPGILIYAHSQWRYFPLTLVLGKRGGGYCRYSLGTLGGATCLVCASVLSKFCDNNSCQSFSSTVFYRLQIH